MCKIQFDLSQIGFAMTQVVILSFSTTGLILVASLNLSVAYS